MSKYIGILMLHAGFSQTRQSIQELIFTLFNGKPDELVQYFGIGPVSGLLASKGLLDQACLSVKRENSIIPSLSEEEEEIEFQNLMISLERLTRHGFNISRV